MAAVTWNPNDKDASIALSNGNLTGAMASDIGQYKSVRATIGKSTGKWYWEITCTGIDASTVMAGVGDASMSLANYVGATANSCGYQNSRYKTGTPTLGSATGGAKDNGDILSLLLDVDAGSLHIWKNGVSTNPWGEMFLSLTGNTWYAACTALATTSIFTANFGATAFAYTPTSGYLAYDPEEGAGLFNFNGFP